MELETKILVHKQLKETAIFLGRIIREDILNNSDYMELEYCKKPIEYGTEYLKNMLDEIVIDDQIREEQEQEEKNMEELSI